MFKTVFTLFRGTVAVAEEELQDRTALVILDQQMRDAAAAVERSKRTLALAIAGDQQEGRRLDATNARIADLETRATAALDGGREDLAREAAQAIANLEAERDAAMTARTLFASEITRLKRHELALIVLFGMEHRRVVAHRPRDIEDDRDIEHLGLGVT